MANLLHIGNLTFSSKKAAKNYIESIIESYDIDTVVADTDLFFVKDLVATHPYSDAIIGSGIAKVVVHHSALFGNKKHFYIQNKDGRMSLFNWKESLATNNIKYTIYNAFRHAIKLQLNDFKKLQLLASKNPVCPFISVKLDDTNSTVMHHHAKSLYVLVNDFLKKHSLALLDVEITCTARDKNKIELHNSALCKKWQRYHLLESKLGLVSLIANQQPTQKPLFKQKDYSREFRTSLAS